jgi:hypothetical protein
MWTWSCDQVFRAGTGEQPPPNPRVYPQASGWRNGVLSLIRAVPAQQVTLAKVRAELPGRGSGAATILIHSLHVTGP